MIAAAWFLFGVVVGICYLAAALAWQDDSAGGES